MNQARRAETNRQNAAHSTGPVTLPGKQWSSLNALRHGLTGQTVVLPSDDLAAYQKFCQQHHAEFQPQGLLETEAVQTIADTHWRLNRIRAMENNLFSLGFQDHSDNINNADPMIHCALAQARAVQANSGLLVHLSLYEQRLHRTLAQAEAKLKQLEQERRPQSDDLWEASLICNLKKALGQPWQPQDGGFEFSTRQLAAWNRHRELSKQAHDFWRDGALPKPNPPEPGNDTTKSAAA